jgi:hypothetical protein
MAKCRDGKMPQWQNAARLKKVPEREPFLYAKTHFRLAQEHFSAKYATKTGFQGGLVAKFLFYPQ